jgi:YgiT-type zinc finger domain-containing protein
MENQASLPETFEQCGSTDMRQEQVRSAFWHQERLVVIEDIPALVCGSCREQYYDDLTVMLIDQLRGENFPAEQARSELRVPVFSIKERLPR